MPTCVEQFERARARRARRSMPRCSSRISAICCSIVCSGLSDVIGSWKIMVMSLPRTARSSRSSSAEQLLALEFDRARADARRRDRAAASEPKARSRICPSRIRRRVPASRPWRCRRKRGRPQAFAPALSEGDGEIAHAQQGSGSRHRLSERLARVESVAHALRR